MHYAATIYRTACLLWLCTAWASCLGQASGPLSLNEIVRRMQAAEGEARTISYYVFREYRLYGSDPTSASIVKAEVEYLAPATKQFGIQDTGGSERATMLVRKVLEHEAKMASHPPAWELTPANYGFTLLGVDTRRGRQCYVLGLEPRRQTGELVRGKAWVDTETFLIARVEGEPAKSPSWWVKNLHLVMEYGEADGLWLPMQTKATADLRLFGRHTLTSQNLQVRALAETASMGGSRTTPAKPKRTEPLSPSGLWVTH